MSSYWFLFFFSPSMSSIGGFFTVAFADGRLWRFPPLPPRVRYDPIRCLLNKILRPPLVVLCRSTPVEMLTARGRTLKSLSPGAGRSFFFFQCSGSGEIRWAALNSKGCHLSRIVHEKAIWHFGTERQALNLRGSITTLYILRPMGWNIPSWDQWSILNWRKTTTYVDIKYLRNWMRFRRTLIGQHPGNAEIQEARWLFSLTSGEFTDRPQNTFL